MTVEKKELKGKKEISNKKKKKDDNKDVNLGKIERILCIVVGIVFIILLIMSINNNVFIPATLLSLALELFCICYYYIEDDDKKTIVYTLFGIGVALVIFEVIYIIAVRLK